MADEKKTDNESIQAIVTAAGKKLIGRDLIILGCMIGGIVYVTLWAKSSFAQTVQTQVDAGMSRKLDPALEEIRLLKQRADEKEAADAAFKQRVEARFDSQETDIRALYRAMMTGERQPRLEKPAPALPPDAGR